MLCTCLIAITAGLGTPQDPPPGAEPRRGVIDPDTQVEIGVSVYVGDAEVRGYDPAPALRTKTTTVTAARFAAIDVHCHWSVEEDPDRLLAAMDERNVRCAVNLSGGWGAHLDTMLERFAERAPDRLVVFCNIDFTRLDDPTFEADTAAFLESARARGVRGLKIFKDLGLRVRDASGEVVAIDDPRLDVIWSTCGRLGMPVLIHSADPIAFFTPIDERNERWMQLRRHPDWSFHGDAFPDRKTVLAQRQRVFERHPRTQFIAAHVGGYAEDLDGAARLLDACPNVFLEISGRVAELGRQPYAARRLLTSYADRVLFGTDRFPGRADQPRYRIYFRFLETDDEYFKYYDHPFPPTGEWRIYGVFLPNNALVKIYHDNAARLLGLPAADAE